MQEADKPGAFLIRRRRLHGGVSLHGPVTRRPGRWWVLAYALIDASSRCSMKHGAIQPRISKLSPSTYSGSRLDPDAWRIDQKNLPRGELYKRFRLVMGGCALPALMPGATPSACRLPYIGADKPAVILYPSGTVIPSTSWRLASRLAHWFQAGLREDDVVAI